MLGPARWSCGVVDEDYVNRAGVDVRGEIFESVMFRLVTRGSTVDDLDVEIGNLATDDSLRACALVGPDYQDRTYDFRNFADCGKRPGQHPASSQWQIRLVAIGAHSVPLPAASTTATAPDRALLTTGPA